MSSENQGSPPGDEGPRTSWVRMPTRDERSPASPTPPEPAPSWTPPTAQGRPPPREVPAGAPFGGFQPSSPDTAWARRSTDRRRFWGVLALLLLVIALGTASVVLTLRMEAAKPKPEPGSVAPPAAQDQGR